MGVAAVSSVKPVKSSTCCICPMVRPFMQPPPSKQSTYFTHSGDTSHTSHRRRTPQGCPKAPRTSTHVSSPLLVPHMVTSYRQLISAQDHNKFTLAAPKNHPKTRPKGTSVNSCLQRHTANRTSTVLGLLGKQKLDPKAQREEWVAVWVSWLCNAVPAAPPACPRRPQAAARSLKYSVHLCRM